MQSELDEIKNNSKGHLVSQVHDSNIVNDLKKGINSYVPNFDVNLGGNSHQNIQQFKTISFVKGKGNLNHNNREFIAKNVDKEKTKDNVEVKHEKLEDAYQKCFGDAIAEYNKTQKMGIVKTSATP